MRFPWSSHSSREQVTDAKRTTNGTTTSTRQHLSPTVEIPVMTAHSRGENSLKRKRPGADGLLPATKNAHTLGYDGTVETNGVKTKNEDRSQIEQQSHANDKMSEDERVSKRRPKTSARARRARDRQLAGRLSEAYDRSGDPDSSLFTPLQQTIESQFSLEILLKHQELRLVEQELAKCQVALEQLRRCRLIPYPVSESTEMGTAEDASSWLAHSSVTSGPYTRHYAKWLIPDHRFDGPMVDMMGNAYDMASMGMFGADGRPTRGHMGDGTSQGGKGRLRGVQNGSAGQLQALSNGYPQPKDKSAPPIVKRSSDGQFVKLVCLDCERADFSSAQGFINHCRIAHHRGFESHDAAANACGQVVELDQMGAIVNEGEGAASGPASLVHPLIRSTPSNRSPSWSKRNMMVNGDSTPSQSTPNEVKTPPTSSSPSDRRKHQAKTKGSNARNVRTNPNFTPSTRTPHLSALMQKRGVDGNLGEMVGEAENKFDFSVYSSEGSESEEDEVMLSHGVETVENAQQPGHRGGPIYSGGANGQQKHRMPGMRMPATSRMSPAALSRPGSRGNKGSQARGGRQPEAVNGVSSGIHEPESPEQGRGAKPRSNNRRVPIAPDTVPSDTASSPPTLSPPSLEGANAPSLVSDDGEYGAPSESESPSSAEVDDDAEMVDFEVEDDDQEVDGSETTAATDPEIAPPPQHSPIKDSVPRRAALRHRGINDNPSQSSPRNSSLRKHDERHVSFVSPESSTIHEGVRNRRGGRKRGGRK